MTRERLIPQDGLPDIRGMYRFALAERSAARRQGRTRHARLCDRLITRCLRTLRFAARMKAGRARGYPHSSHPLFSDTPEKVRETIAPTPAPDSDRRGAFREGRRRR